MNTNASPHDLWEGMENTFVPPGDHQVSPKGGVQQSRRKSMRSRLHNRSRLNAITPPVALIEDTLDAATIAFLSGKFGSYKTFVAVAWACAIATGIEWFGHKITTPGPVLYVAGEGSNGLLGRIRSWEEARYDGKEISDERLFVYDGRINLADNEPGGDLDFLFEIGQEIRPVLIVIDTLHKCAPGVDENSSRDMSVILDAATRLRETFEATVLFVHHTGHAGTHSRGSSSLEDDADTVWLINRGDDTGPGVQRTLVHRKTKRGALQPEIPIMLKVAAGDVHVIEGSVELLPAGKSAETVMEWLDNLGVPIDAGRDKCRDALIKDGRTINNNVLADAIRRRKEAAKPHGGDP